MYQQNDLRQKFAEIFLPSYLTRARKIREENGRFVHHTSAEAAFSIFKTGEFWLRNASCMNDVSEVRHGLDCLIKAYQDLRFGELLKHVLPDVQAFENYFGDRVHELLEFTYLACFSEHNDDEDKTGRLSMWRAYASGTGVAIVMNNRVFIEPSDALGAYTSPVEYMDKNEFAAALAQVGSNIIQNTAFLRDQPTDQMMHWLYGALRSFVLCTKHPGFREEKEWRVVFSPRMPHPGIVRCEIEAINGIPQPVCKIPLADIPEQSLIGADPRLLVDRIIIGPSQYESALYQAFVELLASKGIENAAQRVVVSDIPLRK